MRVTLEMTKVLVEFIAIYQRFGNAKARGFNIDHDALMDFLTALSQGEISTYDDLKEHFDKTATDPVGHSVNIQFVRFSSSPSITAASPGLYREYGQQWLTRIEKDSTLLEHFKTAAELLLQAIPLRATNTDRIEKKLG